MAVRCPYGFPAVVETRPYLEDGTPFPTLYYLTCPSAVAAVSRLEEQGGVEVFRGRLRADASLRAACEALTRTYAARRAELAPPPGDRPDGGSVLGRGIGGPADPTMATCLHAQAAALLAVAHGRLRPAGTSEAAVTASAEQNGVGSEGAAPPTGTELSAVWRDMLAAFGDLWCADRRCREFGCPGALRAAIDVGTNSVRLLVARVTGTGVQVLIRRAEVTRLGEGLSTEPRPTLAPAARARTAAAVERYVAEARDAGVDVIRLVGTSACRVAVDGREFIAGLGRRWDVEAAVVSGEAEAALAFTGATLDVAGSVVLVDVGGGSTELVTRAAASEGGVDLAAVSLPIGCVSGTERWFSHDPPTSAERAAARAEVVAAVSPYRVTYGLGIDVPVGPSAAEQSEATLVGVAGTVTTLACLALGLTAYDPERIHLQRLSLEVLAAQVDRLAAMKAEDRAASPCMQRGREEVIVAGGEIVLGVMGALGWCDLVVSERDLLDGIVLADRLDDVA